MKMILEMYRQVYVTLALHRLATGRYDCDAVIIMNNKVPKRLMCTVVYYRYG